MKKIGIFYSFNTKNTTKAATQIMEAFGKNIEAVNVEETDEKEFAKFDNYILGVPTWFDGELPNYWDELLPALEDLDLSGKTFAIYGAGNQKEYSENFVDGIGIMADFIENLGGDIVGYVSTEGYKFDGSKALRDDKFVGLPLDFDTQPKLVTERINNWIKQIKKEFK